MDREAVPGSGNARDEHSVEDDDLGGLGGAVGPGDETESEHRFHLAVGALEDVLADTDFKTTIETYCRTHCGVFEDGEENKLEYMTVYNAFTSLVETWLEAELCKRVPHFSMPEFEAQLLEHAEWVVPDVFDLVMCLTDFNEFKALMLAHKEQARYEVKATEAVAGAGGASGMLHDVDGRLTHGVGTLALHDAIPSSTVTLHTGGDPDSTSSRRADTAGGHGAPRRMGVAGEDAEAQHATHGTSTATRLPAVHHATHPPRAHAPHSVAAITPGAPAFMGLEPTVIPLRSTAGPAVHPATP